MYIIQLLYKNNIEIILKYTNFYSEIFADIVVYFAPLGLGPRLLGAGF